jgi:hypothetical protein
VVLWIVKSMAWRDIPAFQRYILLQPSGLKFNLQPVTAGFLFCLLLDPEDGSHLLLRNFVRHYKPDDSTLPSHCSQSLKSNVVIAFICLFLWSAYFVTAVNKLWRILLQYSSQQPNLRSLSLAPAMLQFALLISNYHALPLCSRLQFARSPIAVGFIICVRHS